MRIDRSPRVAPGSVEIILSDFISPMMAGLMYDGADFACILLLAIVENLTDTALNILLQQHSSPAARFTHAFAPSTYLSFIVVTSPALEETTVPLKPASHIMFMGYPACGLPLFDGLAACDPKFVDSGIVLRIAKVDGRVEAFNPLSRQLTPIILYNYAELAGAQRSEIGAAKAPFL